MMNFVPAPMEDELLYSVVGRWWKRSGFSYPDGFMRVAFGAGFDCVSVRASLPAALVSTCGSVRSHEQALEQHTVLPFYRPYMAQVMFDRLSRVGTDAPTRAQLCGLASLTMNDVRYCPLCALRQFEEDGVAAWLRSHNLPFVQACWLHGCELVAESLPNAKWPVLVPHTLGGVRPTPEGQQRFASESRRLLLDSGDFASASAIAAAWHQYLCDRFGGFRAAARAFLSAFPAATLAEHRIEASEISVTARIMALAHGKAAARNPVFALLLSRLVSADDYASIMRGVSPASRGHD